MEVVSSLINSDAYGVYSSRIPPQAFYFPALKHSSSQQVINSDMYTYLLISSGGHYLADRVKYKSSHHGILQSNKRGVKNDDATPLAAEAKNKSHFKMFHLIKLFNIYRFVSLLRN